MSKAATPQDLEELLGPEPVRDNVVKLKPRQNLLDVERRRPFQLYTYDDIKGRTKKEWLIGDKYHPVLLEGALWQNFGREKSGKTYFTMEEAFCIAFGLDFAGLPVKKGNVIYIIAEGSIDMNFERIEGLCEKHRAPLCNALGLDFEN